MREGLRYVRFIEGKSVLTQFRWADTRPYFDDCLQRTFPWKSLPGTIKATTDKIR
jgi:hypothetical protein